MRRPFVVKADVSAGGLLGTTTQGVDIRAPINMRTGDQIAVNVRDGTVLAIARDAQVIWQSEEPWAYLSRTHTYEVSGALSDEDVQWVRETFG